MNNLLKLEELGQFLLSIILFSQLDFAWWVFPACILLPDLSIVGYLVNNKIGARCYNFFHHKLLAVVIYAIGLWLNHPMVLLTGIILFGHSAMDRVLVMGLNSTTISRIRIWVGLAKTKKIPGKAN